MRFPDAIALWERAINNNGLIVDFHDQNEAIAANFRLQRFRKAYRDTLGHDEMSVYDRFKVRIPAGECRIIIEPIPHLRAASITTLTGEPVPDDEPLGLMEEC